jgi:hypothetical protein
MFYVTMVIDIGSNSATCTSQIMNITAIRKNPEENCTTSRKVAGSIPDGVIGIFH